MRVLVNGAPREVSERSSIATLVPQRAGIAVALNGVVVRRADWADTWVREHDAVEVLTAHQGG